MKVFVNRLNREYSNGVILVAASSEEEADQLYFEKCKADGDANTEDFDDAPDRFKWDRWGTQYPIDGWYEHPTLSANVNTPQIIMEVSYAE